MVCKGPSVRGLFNLAAEVQSLCVLHDWRFCFIGGLALQRWGEPRLTIDIDLSLLTGFGGEESFIDALLQTYASRIDHAREFALKNRVLLLKSKRNIPIDISLACLPFEAKAIDRASDYSFLEPVSLRTCSAEDLIIYKAFADRNRDWADIEGILIRQKDQLDWVYIEEYLLPLTELKQSPHIIAKLKQIRSEFY